MKLPLCLAALAALICASPASCEDFVKLKFLNGEARSGSFHFRLDGPDDPVSPDIWEGPLRINGNKRKCEAQVSVITAVWANPRATFVVVVTESGSSTFVQFIDLDSCNPKWPRIKAFTEEVTIVADRIQIQTGCVCDVVEKPCSCSSAKIYQLHSDHPPVLLELESRALTKRQLGVEFMGDRKVMNPGQRYLKSSGQAK